MYPFPFDLAWPQSTWIHLRETHPMVMRERLIEQRSHDIYLS